MLTKSENCNPNYLAKICKIEELYPIEGADNLLRTNIGGYDMVVSKDMQIGDVVVYFPVESCICEKFLSANNLYEFSEAHKNINFELLQALINKMNAENDADVAKTLYSEARSMCGFFNKFGRVRMIKLRGQYSMGFVIPVTALEKAWTELFEYNFEKYIGESFDTVCGEKLCWKYVPITNSGVNTHHTGDQKNWRKLMRKTIKRFDKLIEGQFEFHYDTKKLEEEISILKSTTNVSVTVKVHGTSVILANVLCNKQLTTWEKIKKFFGCKVQETEYSNIYSSRKVIKNRYINPKANDFYSTDVWGEVNRIFSQFITPSMTVYGEIVGYLPNSSQYIQKNHDYGCVPGQWKFMPYRITLTAKDGSKSEFSVVEVMSWVDYLIEEFGDKPAYAHYTIKDVLMQMELMYNGPLGEMYSDVDNTDENFAKNLLNRMKQDDKWLLMEKNEPLCKNKVLREGVVIRIHDDVLPRAWKLKSKKHYELEAKQHDNNDVDIEEVS